MRCFYSFSEVLEENIEKVGTRVNNCKFGKDSSIRSATLFKVKFNNARENHWKPVFALFALDFYINNLLGYLSADIICSEKRTVFQEQSSRKTVCYEEQIMSKDKYPNIIAPNGGCCLNYPSKLHATKLGDI